MKIHPLLAQMIETLHFSMEAIVTGGAQRRRAYVEWNTAGKPVIEESTAQADIEDKHPPLRDLVNAGNSIGIVQRDARIKDLEKVRADLLVDRDTFRNRCGELEIAARIRSRKK